MNKIEMDQDVCPDFTKREGGNERDKREITKRYASEEAVLEGYIAGNTRCYLYLAARRAHHHRHK